MSPYGTFFIIQPDKSRISFDIPSPVLTIGRDAQNALQLQHPDVAPFHARLEWRQGQAFVIDVSGAAGVYVNQARVQEQALRQGDVLKIGEYFIVFHPPAAAAAPPPPASGPWSKPAPPPPPPPAGAFPSGSSGLVAPIPVAPLQPRGGPAPLSPTPTHLPSVVAGGVNQRQLQSNQVVRIGRDPANTIALNSLQSSRFHAEVVSQGGQYAIRDLGSTNGTFVNGQRIPPQTMVPLQRGSLIKISDYSFYFDGQQLEHYSEEGNARIDAINLRRVVAGGQVLLHDISLSIQPREFVAVVGGSGAGKSTLVNALSGFRPADQGTVLLNGLDYYTNLEAFRSTLGYVPQDDIIHPELTTYRALHYAAMLRMPEDVSDQEREGRIEEVLRDLHLTERREVAVSRLSGGQRKRVSIGVELLTKPRLFFLDEPTSGLDPGMEHDMMKIFRQLADQGHTMILITHATTNIMLCDKIAFLARGGYLAFFGPPREALQYFGASDFTEIYTKVDNQKSPQQWDAEFKASPYYQKYVVARLNEVSGLVAQARANPQASLPASARKQSSQASSGSRQFGILLRRYVDIISRDRLNLTFLLAQAPVLALVLLVVVLGKQDLFVARNAQQAGTGQKFIFLLSLFSLMCGTLNSARELVKELPIYKRERNVNLRIFPYLMSKFIVLAAVSAFQSAAFVMIIFNYLDKPHVDSFMAQTFLVLWLTNLAGVAMGLAVSAMVPNQNLAMTLLPVVLLPQVVLCGILVGFEGETAKLLPNLTILKWGGGMLGHLLAVHTWPVPPIMTPRGPQMIQPPSDIWDIPLLPDGGSLGGVLGLTVYAVLCLVVASFMLAEKDKRKD